MKTISVVGIGWCHCFCVLLKYDVSIIPLLQIPLVNLLNYVVDTFRLFHFLHVFCTSSLHVFLETESHDMLKWNPSPLHQPSNLITAPDKS